VSVSLERDDIIAGLRDLVDELSAAGEVAGIRIVGGAALALRYFDRGVTRDVDTLHVNPGSDSAVAAAAARVAARRDWDESWLGCCSGSAPTWNGTSASSSTATRRAATRRRPSGDDVEVRDGEVPFDEEPVVFGVEARHVDVVAGEGGERVAGLPE